MSHADGRRGRVDRRAVLRLGATGILHAAQPVTGGIAQAEPAVLGTGAEALVAASFAPLQGRRVGLLTNHTGRVGDERLVDVLARAAGVRLAAILTPEHGLGGAVEAGASVASARDKATGLPVHSLYGATLKPTRDMLAGLDVLVFDMQDVGVRFYTYLSTMGLAMQAAARARIPFVVLDRPNPLGGEDVAGFVLEARHRSFIGLYAIPQVHGLTAGELARMLAGERLLGGLAQLDLEVVRLAGWRRGMRWPATGRAWLATSPNLPTFETALAYAGTGLVEQTAASEGRGTETPFLLVGHPAVDPDRLAARLAKAALAGVSFEPARFTRRQALAGVLAGTALVISTIEVAARLRPPPPPARPGRAGVPPAHVHDP